MKAPRMAFPSSSTAKLVSLQDLCRDNGGQDHDLSPSNRRQLAVLPPAVGSETSSRFSRFNLPDGWIIEEVPRFHGYRIDRYYYEVGTGMKFRSLPEVQRYINGEERTPRSRAHVLCSYVKCQGYPKHIIYGGKVIKLDGKEFNQKQLALVKSTTDVNLPKGWIIEKVPRRFGGCDKYYYEPGTGQKFRSRIDVLRHLQGLEEDTPISAYIEERKENASLSKPFKLRRKGKNCASRNRQTSTRFVSPPKTIKWVLGSTGGDVWYPFNFKVPVPESVKQQWNQRFMEVMKDEDNAAPKCD